jgi:hypothetical protein
MPVHVRRFFGIALVAALVLASSSVASAAGSEQAAVMAPILQFINGLNNNDVKSALAACASPASIVDEVPPHEWQGPTACADWLKSYNADDAKDNVVGGPVTLGTPWHVDIHGATAYVVIPATYRFTQNRKPTDEAAVFTVALKKAPAGWLITGWTWSKE